jgi:hypothetical protein
MPGYLVLLALMLIATPCLAKRTNPPEVPPVESGGIRYLAPNTSGRVAYVEAWEIRNGKKLWTVAVFTNRIRPGLEEDVQWVYIRKLEVVDGRLVATDEEGRTHFVDLKKQAPEAGKTVLILPDAPLAISWSPTGKDCIYIVGDELRDWPRGRRLRLPKREESGLYWTTTARWRGDGKEVAVVVFDTTVLIVDFGRFAVTRTLRNTFPVWWSGRTLCYAQVKRELTPAGHQVWHYGGIRHRTPRGTYLSDVSDDGRVALAYLARRRKPQEALMALDSRTGRLQLLRAFPAMRGDDYYRDYHYPQRVVMNWNPEQRAAAVLYAFTWADIGFQCAYFTDAKRSYDVERAVPDYLVFADQPPDWQGDDVLAKVRLFTEYDKDGRHIAEDWYRLVLWYPKKAAVKTLLNYGGERPEDAEQISSHDPLGVFALSPDGKRLAYSRFQQKENLHQLIITDFVVPLRQ